MRKCGAPLTTDIIQFAMAWMVGGILTALRLLMSLSLDIRERDGKAHDIFILKRKKISAGPGFKPRAHWHATTCTTLTN